MKKVSLILSAVLITANLSFSQLSYWDTTTLKLGIMNYQGEKITQPIFDYVPEGEGDEYTIFFNEGHAVAYINGEIVLVDSTGYFNKEFKYEGVGEDRFSEGLFSVYQEDEKLGFVNSKHKLVISYQYDGVGCFCDNISWVRNGKVYNFINKQGKLLSNIWFDDVMTSEHGTAYGKKNDEVYKINENGVSLSNIKVQFDFRKKYGCYKFYPVNNRKLFAFKDEFTFDENEKWGYKNEVGEIVLTPKYDKAQDFQGDFAVINLNGREGVINYLGKYIIEPSKNVNNIFFFKNYFQVMINWIWHYYNNQGEEIILKD